MPAAADPPDEARAAYDDAERLAKEGRYQEALEKHLWYHDHALEINRGCYGVRLSYALSSWVRLGEVFPAAREALKQIRDSKTHRLLEGETDRHLFHDVVAINSRLNETSATVELFKMLDADRPDFATQICVLADKDLIAAAEHDLVRKHLGDPAVRFAGLKTCFEVGLQIASEDSGGDLSRRVATESNFTDSVLRLVTLLDRTGDRHLAREIQSMALAVFEDPAIRGAIRSSDE